MAEDDELTSHIWDITYHNLHQILAGDLEGHSLEDVAKYVRQRSAKLMNCVDPFGTPSSASRSKVESGSITLEDGFKTEVPSESRQVVWAISRMLGLDEVDAFILWKIFLRNRGLPSDVDTPTDEEILDHFIPFYFEERLSILRCIIPLLRAHNDPESPLHDLAKDNFSKIIPKPRDFASTFAKQYLRRTMQPLPDSVLRNPRSASRYAKQSVKEQLVMLEVLFWTVSECSLHDGSLTEEIFKVGYNTNLGLSQENASLLLDEEGVRLLKDMETLWTLILVELLQIDQLLSRDSVETTVDSSLLVSFPEYLTRTQDLIISNVTPRHGCVLLAWACVLAHLSDLDVHERPAYEPIISLAYDRFRQISAYILQPEFGLFQSMQTTLVTSPLFVTAAALATGSPITYPNTVDFRFIYKTLIMGVTQLVQVEFIPDFEGLVEVWISLFGTGEDTVAARVCRNYWGYDWKVFAARRVIFDVARSRFPVHFRPLVRLLRATAGTGSIHSGTLPVGEDDRKLCGAYVYHYFLRLPTFTQVIPVSARTGAGALYEALIDAELYTGGVMYRNIRPIRLPGGSLLPRNSSSRLLSTVTEPTDPVVVEWEHEHSGWNVVLEVLRDYLKRSEVLQGSMRRRVSQRGTEVTLTLEDTGMELTNDEEIITDALDLVRTIIHGNSDLMTELMSGLEPESSGTIQAPDLVEVTTRILEDALSRSTYTKGPPPSRLITSAVAVLTALLTLPVYAYRVWPFLRSTSLIFGSETHEGFTPALLAAERLTGNYDMTLSLIGLVRALFDQAISSLLTSDPVMQPLKEIVLLRAVKFLHREIWTEHSAWKYTKLSDRFDIGRKITSLFGDILRNCPPATGSNGAFSGVIEFVMDVFLFRATTATVNPLVHAISTGDELLDTLARSRRHSDSVRLVRLLEAHTRLARLILDRKRTSTFAAKLSHLEQALCAGVVSEAASLDARRSKLDPIDVVASYIQYRLSGSPLPLESVRLLSALCRSLSLCQVSPPSIVAHLADSEATAAALVRILRHPWDDLNLRNTIWHFITLTVDVQPALGSLFVRGKFYIPDDKGKGKEEVKERDEEFGDPSAVKAACEALSHWEGLWESNPHLLASVLGFLEVVWRHALEHRSALESTRTDARFWTSVAGIGGIEVGPGPEWVTKAVFEVDGQLHSDWHVAVSDHAYKTRAKAHAIQVLALDIELSLAANHNSDVKVSKPRSYVAIERYFASTEDLVDHISEAIANYYDPECHKKLAANIQHAFPALAALQSSEDTEYREFGDDYVFPTELVRERVQYTDDVDAEDIRHQVYTVNLNLSLADAGVALTRSWKRLLQIASPLLRADEVVRQSALGAAESVSGDIAAESRVGSAMAVIHAERLALLLGIMEVSWFLPPSPSSAAKEIGLFVALTAHVQDLITSEFFPPAAALRSDRATRFHRVIIQIIYFCSRKARIYGRQPKAYNAEQRLMISSAVTEALRFIIEGLRDTFDLAMTTTDIELDKDMELLVPTFEQCTRPDLPLAPSTWLARCHEIDIIRASLELLVRTDVTGLNDLSLLRNRRSPLYARHILFFHLTLARLPSSAERLANGGVVAAYANVNFRAALSAGMVEPSISELPGERSPTHKAWCTMLAVITSVTGAMANSHFIDEEVMGFIHLFGAQITQSLTWRVGEPLTLPFLEELGHVVALFNALASCTSTRNEWTGPTLRTYAQRASELLQDLNYALTHPNHLASLLEAVTAEERVQIEKDARNLSVDFSTQLIEPSKRPLLAALVQKLLFVTRDLIASLMIITEAETVLTCDAPDWPAEEALVPPITKISPGEPASTGTLLELGTCAMDILRHLSNDPLIAAAAKQTLSPLLPLPAFSAKATILAASQVLETTLTYAVTQVAIWVEAADHRESPRQLEFDDGGHEREVGEQRRRTSIGGRVRRGEIAVDLKTLLTKSKPVIEKARQQLKLESESIILLLIGFLEKRVLVDA
ncbi:nucleoporin subcomplex protein binding to Pom34-domain-containing protein [Gautieria morchelliformis]|nr:nucleoporin subcomplex protein binding to Pom34-domain-containing protein [Gautieria morchelliformis]